MGVMQLCLTDHPYRYKSTNGNLSLSTLVINTFIGIYGQIKFVNEISEQLYVGITPPQCVFLI